VRTVIVLLLISKAALAGPPPSGVYRLERTASETVYYRSAPKDPDKPIPACEMAPIPKTLVIEYSSTSTNVIVNKEPWRATGFSEDANRKREANPSRTALKPNPPARLEIGISFRADGSGASGVMAVVELDARGHPRCAVGYHFAGTYDP
jgi:hypothetical protein